MLNGLLIEGHREPPADIREVLEEEQAGLYTTVVASPIRTFRKNYKNNQDLFEITFEEIAMSLEYIVSYLDSINPYGDLPETSVLINEFEAAISAEQRKILQAGYSLGDNLNVSQPGLPISELEGPLRTLAEKITLSFVLDRVPERIRKLHRLVQHVLSDTFTFTEKSFPDPQGIFLTSSNPELMELPVGYALTAFYSTSEELPPPPPMRQLPQPESPNTPENIYLHTLLSSLSASETPYTIDKGLRNKRIFLQASSSSSAELISCVCALYGLQTIPTGSSLHITYPYTESSRQADRLRSNLTRLLPWNVQEALHVPPPPEDSKPKSKIEQLKADLKRRTKNTSGTHYPIVNSLHVSSSALLQQELVQSGLLSRPCQIDSLSISQNILLANLVLFQFLSSIALLPEEMPYLLSQFDQCMLYLFDTEWKGQPTRHFSITIQNGTNRQSRTQYSPRRG